jgi:hypothetical protein
MATWKIVLISAGIVSTVCLVIGAFLASVADVLKRDAQRLHKRALWVDSQHVSCPNCSWSGQQDDWTSSRGCPRCATTEKPGGYVDLLKGSNTILEHWDKMWNGPR